MKQKIVQGKLGMASIEGRYELVAKSIAERIKQKNDKRIVIFNAQESADDNDPYSEHQIPDDMMW